MSFYRVIAQAEVGLNRIAKVVCARDADAALLQVAGTLQAHSYYVVSIEEAI